MKYQNGIYEVKIKGRGLYSPKLTGEQAKALCEIMNNEQLEIERITFKHN